MGTQKYIRNDDTIKELFIAMALLWISCINRIDKLVRMYSFTLSVKTLSYTPVHKVDAWTENDSGKKSFELCSQYLVYCDLDGTCDTCTSGSAVTQPELNRKWLFDYNVSYTDTCTFSSQSYFRTLSVDILRDTLQKQILGYVFISHFSLVEKGNMNYNIV